MRILHISSARSWRGGERQIHYLVSGQSEKQHDVYLMCPSLSPLLDRCASEIAEHIPLRRGAVGMVRNMMSLAKFCKRERIDIIHAHDSHSHTLVWMCYEASLLTTKSIVSRRLDNPIKKNSLKKYNQPNISKIICVSDAVKARMAPQITNKDRLVTIHSGIDLSNMSQDRTRSLDSKVTIGYVAAFTKEKNHDLFVKVALKILEERAECKFLLVGDGPLLENIKARVSGYPNSFEFTGFVKDVDAQYEKMDLLLHTSIAEALGTSILDGMKFGLPIVANDVGGINEIVHHGKNGYLAQQMSIMQLVDCVLNIINNHHMYSNMTTASKALVLSFDKREMEKKTTNLYSEVINM